MSARLRIAIVGGGIAGASLAAQLQGRGHTVDGFERSNASSGGAGLLLAPPALVLLRAMGLDEIARARGTVVFGLRATRADGSVLLHWDACRWGYSCIGLGIQRSVLHEILLAAATSSVQWHRGIGIQHVEPIHGWLTDAEGHRHGPYDVVVASDGANSRLRAAYPELVTRSQYYRWTALSCLMRLTSASHSVATLEQYFRGAHHIAIWPVGKTEDGAPVLCVSINVPAESAAQFTQPDSGMAELRRLGFVRMAALDGLHPVTPWVVLRARDVALRRYFHQRLVFLGDAAHSLSPVLGQGTRLALAGATTLAAALDHRDVADALTAYDRQQRRLATHFQDWSRWVTPLLQSPGRTTQWLRDRLFPTLARLAPIERSLSQRLCSPL